MAITADSVNLFRRAVRPAAGGLTQELASFVRSLDFDADDHRRYEELSAKAQKGRLSIAEADELDSFLHIDSLLAILRLKAERSTGGPAKPDHG